MQCWDYLRYVCHSHAYFLIPSLIDQIVASFPFTVPLIKWVSGSITDSFARLHSNTTTGDDHELQRSDGRDWAFSFNHQSEWCRMPSESTENIAGGLSGTVANSKQQTNQLEVQSQNKG